MRIYLERNPHKIWETYRTHPPLKYSRLPLFCEAEHTFNRVSGSRRKKIVETEHILHLSGFSRDYKIMLDMATLVKKRILENDVLNVIFPTIYAKLYAIEMLQLTSGESEKLRVVPPAVTLKESCEHMFDDSQVRLLFIGNKFYGKGGNIVFRVAQKCMDLGINTIFKFVTSDIPLDIEVPKNLEVIIKKKLKAREKQVLFDWADYFIFPVLHDSFGVHMECIETSTPMLTTNIYDKSEILTHSVSSYLYDTPIQLYGEGFGDRWMNWDEFISNVIKVDSEGGFDKLVDSYVDVIKGYLDSPNEYRNVKQEMKTLAVKRFDVKVRNSRLLDIYHAL